MITITEGRDRLNASLQDHAEDAADTLARVQRQVAAKFGNGQMLNANDLDRLVKAQAEAGVWAQVAQVREYWADNPGRAPERTDMVEAAHEVRTKAVRRLLNQRGTSTSAMDNELERVQDMALRDFIRLTAAIYPEDSPLRDLV